MMKIQRELENAVYFDFTDCNTPIFKVTCVKKHSEKHSDKWDIILSIPRSFY